MTPTDPTGGAAELVVVAGGDVVCLYPLDREAEAATVALVWTGAGLDSIVRRMSRAGWERASASLRARGEQFTVNDFTKGGSDV
jgi:hypothetical protein